MPLLTDIRILFGKLMRATMADPATTIVLAREAYDYWISVGASRTMALALLGNEDGESSFRPSVVGDRGEAHGIFQWHAARIHAMMIAPECGIDVRTASHADQLKAAFFEMTKGGYRHVWPNLTNAADTLEAKITVLVSGYEGSAQQARDIARRVGLAQKWAGVILEVGNTSAT